MKGGHTLDSILTAEIDSVSEQSSKTNQNQFDLNCWLEIVEKAGNIHKRHDQGELGRENFDSGQKSRRAHVFQFWF